MPMYRNALPQLDDRLFLTDGGLETTLIFHNGIDLPHFAAFDLLRDHAGRRTLTEYYLPYVAAAQRGGTGMILDSATWRANPDWGAKLGYGTRALAAANREAIDVLTEQRAAHETPRTPMVVSGAIGPRGDGYAPEMLMTASEAEAYHSEQITVFSQTEADMIGAFTMTHSGEAIGIARAAAKIGMPVMISFTVETNGRLPSGEGLGEAIMAVDEATGRTPAYYMINCAHPDHFGPALTSGGTWLSRLRGVRANASRRSHTELNEAPDLDAGNPHELGAQYRELRRRFPAITILGGCCGTDHRHIDCISAACAPGAPEPAATP